MKLMMPLVDYSEGFSRENDIFNRKPLSKKLENIIRKSEDESLVIALDDNWGSGKTTFLKMWEGEIIKNDEFKVVYFDAFQNDFQSDPFVALSAKLYALVEDNDLKERYLEATKKVGGVVLKAAAKIGIGALTLGLVKGSDIENISESISDAISNPIETYIEEKLKGAEQEEKTIEHFKTVLSEIAEDKKLIFIIDELDRARPNYSLELLERVKHIFNSKNIFFILATNKKQHLSIIKKTYGDIDANTYLNKFINFWFNLPAYNRQLQNNHVIDIYADKIQTALDNKINEQKVAFDSLKTLIRANGCSLRDYERCYALQMLVLAAAPEGLRWEFQIGVAILVFLKVKDEVNYIRVRDHKIKSRSELMEILNLPDTHKLKPIFPFYVAINTEYMSEEEFNSVPESESRTVFNETFGDQLKVITGSIEFIENLLVE